jgi:hypothetical protein
MKLRGGIHYGLSYADAINATWPFATLDIEEEKLTIKALWKTFSVPKSKMKALSRYSGLFSNGLRIEHTFNFHDVQSRLAHDHYVVNELT